MAVKPGTDMREHIKEQADLAVCYAEDGAYTSAARVLRTLAQEVQAHAEFIAGSLPE